MSVSSGNYTQFARELWLNSPLLLKAVIAIFAAIVFFQSRKKPDVYPDIPAVGTKGWESTRRREFMSNGAKLYVEGYQKYKGGIFRITTARESPCIVVAPKFLPELNRLPEEILSFAAAIQELMHTNHIDIYNKGMEFPHAVKAFITPSLGRLNPILSNVLDQAIEDELPQSSSWVETKINEKLVRMVAKASGRVFIGSELCGSEKYLDTSINFTIDVMKAVFAVAFLPVWLRSVVTPMIPFVWTVYRRLQEANDLLLPVIKARRLAIRSGSLHEPDNMLDWLVMEQSKAGIEDDHDLVQKQLGATFASIHTTTQILLHTSYTLAAQPEIASMLRDEAREVLHRSSGEYTTQALQELKKLDSFMKELLRFYPLQACEEQPRLMSPGYVFVAGKRVRSEKPNTISRKVVQPITLSNGQVLPAGVIVEAPNGPISGDPEIFHDAHIFDPLRFYNLRQAKDAAKAEVVANSQFVSSGALSLSWGYGRHACPGRFFAANEVKIATSKILLQYDMKLPAGVTERHPNITFGDMTMPDPGKTVMLKRRV